MVKILFLQRKKKKNKFGGKIEHMLKRVAKSVYI